MLPFLISFCRLYKIIAPFYRLFSLIYNESFRLCASSIFQLKAKEVQDKQDRLDKYKYTADKSFQILTEIHRIVLKMRQINL
ncbi:MAG: hypothetical protein DYG84_14855 [Candidatus Brocadia sp. AMX3]|nr:hypothetical protein [Candidatus Brocadia sp. AMX3]